MKKRLTLIIIILLLILIFINSNFIVSNILNYTDLFINKLFVYTFIIYTASSLLVDYDLLSILKPTTYITIMSIISGFPSSSKYIKDLLDKGYIDIDTSNYLITYTSYPNPLFIIGSVSSIIGKSISIKLLISIYLSSFIVSRIFKVKSINKTIDIKKEVDLTNSLMNATTSSIKTILLIYSMSIISVTISLVIIRTFHLTGISYIILNGIFDLTNGIFSTTLLTSNYIRSILILLFINIGSISIHLQVRSILYNSSIKYSNFIKGRILSSIISLIIFMTLHSL